jgi:site-specific DNA-cytosine methylase
VSRCRRIVDQFLYRLCVDRNLAVMSRPQLRRAALKYAKQDDGRASDAVRDYLKTRPADAKNRGKLLAQARQIMLDADAKLPPVPTSFKPMPMPSGAMNTSADVNSPLYTIEAFSGGGLWELASAIEGNVIIGSSEKWSPANETRKTNEGLLNNIGGPPDLNARTWRPPIRTEEQGGPNIDLLFGGPPCQPFSKGSEMGRAQRDRGEFAEDNMFPITLDWMADLQPRVVIWENAPELVKSKKMNEYIKRWQQQARDIGYDSTLYLLEAAHFGNPTLRKRTFVVAWPTGAWWGAALREAPVGNFAKPQSPEVMAGDKLPYVPASNRLLGGCCNNYGLVDCEFLGNYAIRCRTCLGGSNFAPAANTGKVRYESRGGFKWSDHGRKEMKGETVTLREKYKLKRDIGKYKKDHTFRAGSTIPWTIWVQLTAGQQSNQQRIEKFTPADAAGVWTRFVANARDLPKLGLRVSEYLMRTITKADAVAALVITDQIDPRKYRESGKGGGWDEKILAKLKVMSIRDIAKLQDVPQWYKIEGSRSAAIGQLGNGVPINLGRAVIRHVRAALNLPLRAPWWETEVPRTPHSPRFETVEQIAAKNWGTVPTKRGDGSGWPDGLWPMQTFSMCYGFPGLVGPLSIMPGGMEDPDPLTDWEQMLDGGIIGSQDERRSGRSKQQMGPDISDPQRRKRNPLFGRIFTYDGLNTEALWQTGWRGGGFRGYPDEWMLHMVSRVPDADGTFYTGQRADLAGADYLWEGLGAAQQRGYIQNYEADAAYNMWPEYFALQPFLDNYALLFGLHDRLSLKKRGLYEEAVEAEQDPFDEDNDFQLFPIASISEFPELTDAVVKEFRDTFFKGKSIKQARSEMKKAAAQFVKYENQP